MGKYFLLIIICLIGLALLSSRQQTKITVEVDVFSGRPNPNWTLTKEESAELSKLINSLPTVDMINLPEGKLGFRGFIIYGLELNRINSNMRIYVVNDIVSVYDVYGHRQDLHDQTKSIFNILQVMSSTHLEPDLYKVIFGN